MFIRVLILLTALHLLVITNCQTKDKEAFHPLVYLFKYGYVSTKDFTENTPLKSRTIKSFQTFAGLPGTGILDRKTFLQMRKPRCGMLDEVDQQNKKFTTSVQKTTTWLSLFNKRTEKILYWCVKNGGQQISKTNVEKMVRKGFQLWSSACDIRFKQVQRNDADIDIKFVRKGHGDGNYFDGRGGILAHAFYPQSTPQENKKLVGDIHFDDDELFEVQTEEGRNHFLWLATHEIGHSLGLGHSQIKSSVMFPWYGDSGQKQRKVQLHKSDIAALRRLYKNVELAPPVTPNSGLVTPNSVTTHSLSTTDAGTTPTFSTDPLTTSSTIQTTTAMTNTKDITTTNAADAPTKTSIATPKVTTQSESETSLPSTTPIDLPTSTSERVTATTLEASSTNPSDLSSQPYTTVAATTEFYSTADTKETTSEKVKNKEKAANTKESTLTCPRAVDQIEAVYHSSRYGISFIFNENNMLSFVRPNSVKVLVVSRFNYLPKIGGNIDATLNVEGEYKGPYQVIFSGESYYLYRDFVSNVFKKAGPYSIYGGENPMNFQFPTWMKKINAAMTWTADGMTYFFTDGLYWKYDTKQKQMMKGYPKQIKRRWEGAPDQINAALSSKELGLTYFISGDTVYILNDKTGYVRETMTVAELLKCP